MDGSTISFINLASYLHDKGVTIYVTYPEEKVNEKFLQRTSSIISGYFHVPIAFQMIAPGHSGKIDKIKNIMRRDLLVRKLKLKPETDNIVKLIHDLNPDIVHTNVGIIQGGYYASVKCGVPHVWHIREYQTKDFGWKFIPSYNGFVSLLHKSYVITISNDLLRHFKLEDSQNAVCIYNGCFPQNQTSYVYPKERYFLCCSRIKETKGFSDVINSFAEFYKNNLNWKLIIAGTGDPQYINNLKSLAEELGCGNAVEFCGFKDNVRPLMEHAQALIVASKFEGFGRMTAEAAFCGCLVIGRNTGGTAEILRKTGGFLFSDCSELSNAMNTVSSISAEEYRNLAMRAQHIAKKYFSNESSGSSVYEFYKKIISSSKKNIY